ncbi:hypothetical protein [Algoriphagus sp.]|uniref:hypothetical protein n=1 Tax=Algoriphagus sp. TaxID=1872435 RepID=UPI003F7267CD
MKKLSLGRINLLSDEVLERSQLSTIYGGLGGSEFGTCGAKWRNPDAEPNDPNPYIVTCGWSMATAVSLATQNHGWYCCDSCTNYCT